MIALLTQYKGCSLQQASRFTDFYYCQPPIRRDAAVAHTAASRIGTPTKESAILPTQDTKTLASDILPALRGGSNKGVFDIVGGIRGGGKERSSRRKKILLDKVGTLCLKKRQIVTTDWKKCGGSRKKSEFIFYGDSDRNVKYCTAGGRVRIIFPGARMWRNGGTGDGNRRLLLTTFYRSYL